MGPVWINFRTIWDQFRFIVGPFLDQPFFFSFQKNHKIYFQKYAHIQQMTLNLIETLKTSICIPKHTKNTKMHDHFLENKKHIFQKIKSKNQRCLLFCLAIYPFFVYLVYFVYAEGHTA